MVPLPIELPKQTLNTEISPASFVMLLCERSNQRRFVQLSNPWIDERRLLDRFTYWSWPRSFKSVYSKRLPWNV